MLLRIVCFGDTSAKMNRNIIVLSDLLFLEIEESCVCHFRVPSSGAYLQYIVLGKSPHFLGPNLLVLRIERTGH